MKNTKVTFELTDLTYEELVNLYKDVIEFLDFLSEKKIKDKDKEEEKNDV